MLKQYVRILPTRWGNFATFECDPYITGSLAAYGDSTLDEVRIALALTKPGDVVIDAGANVGTFSVPLAQRVGPSGQLYSFEPQRLVCMALTSNLFINSVGEWSNPIPAALGDECGIVKVHRINPRMSNNIGGARVNDEENKSGLQTLGLEDVDMVTIDSLDLPRLDFIKIDTEGMDWRVILGGWKTIERCQPAILCECMPDDFDPEAAAKLRETLEKVGYCGWKVITRLYSPDNARMNTFNMFADVESHDVVALPKTMQLPVDIAAMVANFSPL